MWRIGLILSLWIGVASVGLAQTEPISGQIAVTGDDGNIYLYTPATDTRETITTNAIFSETGRFYAWPTWASDGQLAFFGQSYDPANLFRLGVFIRGAEGGEAKGVYAARNESFTYASWSPGGRDLALLYTTRNGLATRIIRPADDFAITEVSQGGPHYWDWSPDGTKMLWMRFGDRYELYDADEASQANILAYTPGYVTTPDWSPSGDRLLIGVGGSDGTALITVEVAGETVLLDGLTGPVAYGWSPTGEQAAFIQREIGALSIIDLEGNRITPVLGQNVLSFFWSPDGTRMAIVSAGLDVPNRPSAKQDAFALQWVVYDVASGTLTRLADFIPTNDFWYFLQYFDQFSRSHRIWSPDGTAFAYPTLTLAGIPVIALQNADGGEPQEIGGGVFATFSWE